MVTPRRFVIVDDSTIREKRDHEEERRPRKRVDTDDKGTPEPAPHNDRIPWPKYKKPCILFVKCNVAIEKESLEHDPVYFEEGPDRVIVRIENMLFKVSRSTSEFIDFCNDYPSSLETCSIARRSCKIVLRATRKSLARRANQTRSF
jgi:hypothetical protein